MTTGLAKAPRAYRSGRRADRARRTRQRVLRAAGTVFLARGYAGGTMRAVAAEAGVSVPTLEQLFGTKARLLKAAIDVAIAGDDEPVPVLDRDWAREAVEATTLSDSFAVVAGVIGPAQTRSAGLVLAAFEGAATDPELADLAAALTEQRATTAAWLVDLVAARGGLRAGLDRADAVDTVWVLMDPAVFERLTRRHWSVDRYQRWFADATMRLLTDDPSPTRRTRPAGGPTPMSSDQRRPAGQHPPHGQIGYLQLPATDVARSAAFYEAVFGWAVESRYASFEAPGMIGQWTTDRPAAPDAGPVVWICADDLARTLARVIDHGGAVPDRPRLDDGERWLVEVDDPAGNRIGVVVPARTGAPQPLIAVRDVEASSRWYQHLLGLRSDHGGPEYERLLADGVLVLQLHRHDVEHHHGRVGDPDAPVGNGVLLWFGDVAAFDDVVARAEDLGARLVRQPHRNPPEGQGNGPGHREVWIEDPDGYVVVAASPDGEAFEPA